MTAPVRIEAEAWSDLRFATLARLLGFADLDHALIKCSRIWSWQTEHYTPDEPTYVVDADLIESALGPDGAAALVRSRLAVEEPGGFRIRGAKGRIEWLWQRRQASARGGEARKRNARNKPEPGGYPDGLPPDEPGHEPKPSPLPLAPDLLPEDQRSPSARAIAGIADQHPSPAAPASTEHSDLPTIADRAAVRDELRVLLEAARSRAGNARAVAVKPLLAFDRGLDVDLNAHLTNATSSAALARVADQGRHAIAMAELEVTHGGKSFEWFTGAIFAGGNFSRLNGMTAEDAKRPRAAPKGSVPAPAKKPRKPDPPAKPIAPEDRAGPADFAKARAELGHERPADREVTSLHQFYGDARAGPALADFPDDPTDDEQPAPAPGKTA